MRTQAVAGVAAFGLVPWVAYAAALAAVGRMRWDHAAIAALAALLCVAGDGTRRFFAHSLPFFGLFLVYDVMRFWPLDAERVLTCSLRDAELLLFGWRDASGALLGPGEHLARLSHPALDLLCAVPYGLYVPIMIGHWLVLYASRPSIAKRFAAMALLTHALGFVTYHLAPAAPPWYVAAHGCAVDPAATLSPAGLLRVDSLLGTTYFEELYRRGATPFGALPSLHAAYPLYGLLCTFAGASLSSRVVQIAYAVSMAFAAVYLGHHYLLDVLLGVAYALLSFAIVRRISRERSERRGEAEGRART